MRLLGNIIWFLLGGVVMGLAWWAVGLVCFISIIGIPWGKACFVLGQFTFFPFGKETVSRKDIYLEDDIGTGVWGFIGNVIWFFVAGFGLALGHLLSAIACFITIIGIPFAIQHLKLVVLSLAPIGQTVVTKDMAVASRMSSAQETVRNPNNQ